VRFLLDTHTVLWALLPLPEKLGKNAAEIISDTRNELYVSAVTAWEIATKVRLGKLPVATTLMKDFLPALKTAGYILLPIAPEHALLAGSLAGEHRDPFDRMIAAQALLENIPILGSDKELDIFGARRIW